MPPPFHSARDLYGWLLGSAQDGGQRALRDVAEFARQDDETLTQRPAAAALLAWGEPGLAALAQNAITTPRVKNIIAALQLLAHVASKTEILVGHLYIHDEQLLRTINATIANDAIRSVARTHLQEVLVRVPTDELLIPLGSTFSFLGLAGEAPSQELIRAMSARWLKIGPSTIACYEDLLTSDADNEPAFQEFLSLHPQLLDPMATQVWAQPDFHGAHEPDFLIRRADSSYLVVEIECPSKLLLTQAGQLSADATHAEKQATDYRSFLSERIVEVRQHFPGYRGCECLVVVGLEDRLTTSQSSALANVNGARHNVRIVGFDWLGRRARSIVENMSAGDVETITRYRVT
jgi:hypothetical protein